MGALARTVFLPHGLFDEAGARHREAVLSPLSGWEETAISEGAALGALDLVTGCVARIGAFEEPDRSILSALARADLVHLAFQLRSQLFGDAVLLVIRCPSPSCRALAHLDLSVKDLSPERAEPAPRTFSVATPEGSATLREPLGEDDERLSLSHGTRAERQARFFSAIVVDLGGRGPLSAGAWVGLKASTRHAIVRGFAENTCAPELALGSRCPSCQALLEVLVDPVALLRHELSGNRERLFAEVHTLAFHYHWSEAEILSLPRPRRWKYIELLNRQLQGRPLVEGWG